MGEAATASDIAQCVADTVLNTETNAGSRLLIVDGGPHLFSVFGHILIPIDHASPRWAMHLAMVYGLNVKDREIAPKVTSWLASHTLYYGANMNVRRWSAYVDGALHLSQYNGRVMRLTGAGVGELLNSNGDPILDRLLRYPLIDDGWSRSQVTEVGPNGPISFEMEDNGAHVLFADDDSGNVPEAPIIGRNNQLFKLLKGISWSRDTLGGLRPHHQVQTMMIWLAALAFPDVFPTKPVLLAEGAPGSGKSACLQMIQQAIIGSNEPFTVSKNGERDFWVTLMRSPLLILDNTDDVIDWLPDQLNAYVTGAVKKERKLHTNTGNVEIRPQGFIAVASQDPRSFRRGDTADRMLVLRMKRRTSGESITTLTSHVASMRNRIYGEWLYYLNRVVAALKLEPQRKTTSRLGDFELFAYACARAFGWQGEVVVPELIRALNRERMSFAAETDIVLDVLAEWLPIGSNAGRKFTIRELFKYLSDNAQTNNKPFVKTPHALAQRLQAPHVGIMFDVVDYIEGDHRVYQITKVRPQGEN